MTVVFYRVLSRMIDLEQVQLKSALVDRARSVDVSKTCVKRALTNCFLAYSCAVYELQSKLG